MVDLIFDHYHSANNFTVHASPDDYGTELLRRYHENLSEIFTDNQVLVKMIQHVKDFTPEEKEVRGKTRAWVKDQVREKEKTCK